MNKKAKIIIGILSSIIILLIIIIILLIKSPKKCKDDDTQTISNNEHSLVGIYHTNYWNNNREATLRLNEDKSCTYPMSSYICKWTLPNKYIIDIELSVYRIRYKDEEMAKQYSFNHGNYTSLESCEDDRLNRWKDTKNNLQCVLELQNSYKIDIIDSGLLVNNHIFTKVKQG